MPRRLSRRLRSAALAVVLILLTPAAAHAREHRVAGNPVVTWNLHAQTAIYEVARQSPFAATRSFAMVQGAVYDAVNAIAGTPYEPLLAAPPARRTDSVDAAVAAAAYQVLLSMFPEQATALRAQYDEALAAVRDGRSERAGVLVGRRAAAAMLAARTGDGAFDPAIWTAGTAPGQWRPTPGLPPDGAWMADLRPFVIPAATAFRTAGPPALSSDRWARELNEVKAYGGVDSTRRTADQTEAALWWHDRRLVEWEIKRGLAADNRLSPLQTARMFAMAEVANVDALIACYSEKRYWNFWRPITAVRAADTDHNPATEADPDWTPLLLTPPFPDHTSGHTCSTGAVMSALTAFFGRDDVPFRAYSADSGTVRHFARFSAATAEVVEARIWGGVHFRSADVQGRHLGEEVTRYILRHEFGRR